MPLPSPSEPVLSREIDEAVRSLASLLASRPEIERLKRAFEEIGRHEAARIMLKDLQERQRRLVEKEPAGAPPSEQEMQEFQKVAEVVGFNPYVRELLDAQLAVAVLLGAVYRALEERLALPRLEDEEVQATPAGPAEQAHRVQPARPRLWVPGQPQGS